MIAIWMPFLMTLTFYSAFAFFTKEEKATFVISPLLIGMAIYAAWRISPEGDWIQVGQYALSTAAVGGLLTAIDRAYRKLRNKRKA